MSNEPRTYYRVAWNSPRRANREERHSALYQKREHAEDLARCLVQAGRRHVRVQELVFEEGVGVSANT